MKEFELIIPKNEYERLREIHKSKRIVDFDDTSLSLIFYSAILSYKDILEDEWYDIHPILERLL